MAKKEMTKTIKGKTLDDKERTYTFALLNYKDGVKLQHKYASIAVTAYKHFTDIFQTQVDSIEDKYADKKPVDTKPKGASEFIGIITHIFNWERTEELAEKLLKGAVISGEDDEGEMFSFTCDKEGFCELFGNDFIEMYTAIFYAAIANYPKYLLPFLDTGDSDSTPDL